jgi:serine O-acetyltransferase
MSHQTTSQSTKKLIEHQIKNLFPTENEVIISTKIADLAFEKTVACIQTLKQWKSNGFDYLVSWQYSTYLYFLSRQIFLEEENIEYATRVYLVNKALNSVELFYRIEMPKYFFLSHTPGLVFAQANYGEYSVFHQSCTVGRSGEDRPILEEGVILYPNSSVIGRCHVRENTVLAPGVQLVNQDTPGNCYVFTGEKGRPIFKEIDEYFADRYFDRHDASDATSC